MTREIDMETWPRKEHYAFFAPMSHPFYSLTFPVDITGLRRRCKRDGRTMLDLSLELNHRLLDGVHVGKFYQTLCDWMETL